MVIIIMLKGPQAVVCLAYFVSGCQECYYEQEHNNFVAIVYYVYSREA